MSIPTTLLRAHPGMGEWAFLHGYRGSIAHGMYEPNHEPGSTDDKDTMAFCVPPFDHYVLGQPLGSRGTVEVKRDPWDIVIYEARKAIRLLACGNPNVLSMLWLPENLYIKITDGGRHLLDHRHLFVGRHVYKPFAGYASQQFYKMEHGAFKGYMGDKRKALVERHGYDTKNAAHLIRLLRMGIEFLRDGELNVQRHDAAELLAIKHGEWPLGKVKAEAERLFRRAEDVCDRSTLPIRPDRDAINHLCVEIVEMELARRNEGRFVSPSGAENETVRSLGDDDMSPIEHTRTPPSEFYWCDLHGWQTVSCAYGGCSVGDTRPIEVVPAEQLRGAVEALRKIAAGPNYAPREEPWSKAEALIALDRLGRQ